MKIGFLFNHDGLHQISHTAPIIAELARYDGVELQVLVSSQTQEERVRALVGDAAAHIHYIRLEIGRVAAALDAALRWIAPFRRLAVLRANRAIFASLDILVVPETTSLLLRDRLGLDKLKFVWIPHGAGDRSVGFRAVARGFDLVLLSGNRVRDRMLAADLVRPDNHAVIGYPKFDTVDPATALPSLFDNDRPTVLYNPHFDPLLSSWYDFGRPVLEWFAGQDRFNLIVAPHVMLFRRTLHGSVEHHRIRWRGSIAARYRDLPHILIDEGSTRSVDMSYTRASDIYLGDASSQIYEWIARPRPAIFIDAANHPAWRADANFAHWRLGQVITRMAELPDALDNALADPAGYRTIQQDAFRATFSTSESSASARAASVIMDKARQWFGAAPN
jgi:hypothetical protein